MIGLSEVVDIGLGGVSYVELIIYELWAGERVGLEMAVSNCRRLGRPMSVSVVPVRQAWKFGKFVGFLGPCFEPSWVSWAAWVVFPDLPCSTGANHCRLRHDGWEKSSHGIAYGPRETAAEPVPNELLKALWIC